MKYTDISFLFLFLPVGILVYYILKDKYKNAFLVFLSVVFYFFVSPPCLLIMLLSVGFDFEMSNLMKRADQNMKKRAIPLFCSVCKSIILVAGSVYFSKHMETALPVGMLCYTLSSLGYIIDVYEGEAPYETSLIDFLLFNCFFGKIFLGPVVTYKEFLPSLKSKKCSLRHASDGVINLVKGIASLKIIALPMRELYLALGEINLSSPTIISSWGKLFALASAVYFGLSGYCKIARGTAELFGMSLPKNIIYPYLCNSVKEFYASFNRSVSAFYGKYVFLPLGAAKKGFAISSLNILLMCMLWGTWFGFELSFALWGLFIGLFICIEESILEKPFQKLPDFVSKIYSRMAVFFSFAIFGEGSLEIIKSNLVNPFLFGKIPFYDTRSIYAFVSFLFPIALSLIFESKAPERIGTFLRNRFERSSEIIIAIFNILVMALVIGYML